MLEEYLGKVTQGDCLDLMKQLPDKSIDLVLTDPPYGLNIDGQKLSVSNNRKHNRKEHEFLGWDNSIPSKEYFDEIFRVSKNQIIWGGNYFVKYFNEGHKGWIIWDKGQYGLTMSDCELAYSNFDIPTRIIKYNRVEILNDKSYHPTQKPIKLFEVCLLNYSDENDIILDPYLGSGTTALACIKQNRQFIGFELEQKYVDIANKRINDEKRKLTLF